MSSSGAGLDAARRLAVQRNLVPVAFRHLTADAFMALSFEALGPTKALLRRFFSDEPWGPADDDALARAVGPGEGRWRRPLDADLALDYGWDDGSFSVRLVPAGAEAGASTAGPSDAAAHSASAGDPGDDGPAAEPAAALGAEGVDEVPGPQPATVALEGLSPDTFGGPVVPEATPNPRSIRFQTGAIHDGPSRWYGSAAAVKDDAGTERLFHEFPEVANVLVGPDFVAVGLSRPGDWERLLAPVLAVVTEEFATADAEPETGGPRVMGGPAGAGSARSGTPAATPAGDAPRRLSRLERAWRILGPLVPSDPADLVRVREAATDADSSRRQVAANLLREADVDSAAADWARLATDRVRSVRRAAVDAMVDVGRQDLRPLLEIALGDTDPWVRWKALRGLAELGAEPSREAIAAHADDPDFRVRLEAAAALRSADGP